MRAIRKLLVTCVATTGLGLMLAVPAQAAPDRPIPADGGDGTVATVTDSTDDASLEGDAAVEGADETPVAPFAAAGVKYGGPIKRSDVIKRAADWNKRNVQYSQTAYAWDLNHGKRYRTDCSGFVSMSWALTSSRTTQTLGGVATKIAWKNLKPGDMVLRKSHHVELFDKWANSSHTKFWI